ncbi:MAG: T9SS type A sorting domain-containing protein [Bacteroidota bacterium]
MRTKTAAGSPLLVFILLIVTSLVAFSQMPYGIDAAAPIGAYLDGAFPDAAPDENTVLPQFLSETGAFTDLETLTPRAGFIPYTLRQPFWSDGAEKTRWVAIPNDGAHDSAAEQVVFSEEDAWTFPAGTVAIKHFELPTDHADPAKTKRLETRFNIIAADGLMYGLTYKWNDDGTDAVLLEGGLKESIAVRTHNGIEIRSWEYPDRMACLACHQPVSGQILGPNTRQLNGDMYYDATDRTANQLATWNHLGIFTVPLDENELPGYLTSAYRDEADTTLEHRALSYLDSNCAYCHRPGGTYTAQFDARLAVPLPNSGIINGFALNNLGILGSAIIVPGDTSRSLIYQRMKSLENQVAMPPVAKGRVDSLGLALIGEWIVSLGSQTSTDDEASIPQRAFIESSYPNPFQHQTTVTFAVERTGQVDIQLFDTNGVAVKSLLSRTLEPGRHTVELSSDDLASGTYFVHIQTTASMDTHPVTVVR